jgi:N4-gp56 family major capsid protein
MAYTQGSSLSVDQTAFDQIAYFALRSEMLFDAAADIQPVAQSMPGTSVKFTIFSELADATATLTETSDVTAVAMADSQVEVTLAEYGNTVNTTAKLRGTSFLDVDAVAANLIGYNAGSSIDTVVANVLKAATNVIYGGGGSTTPTVNGEVQIEDIIEANDVRIATAQLRKSKAQTFNGMYMAFIHPDVSYDLRRETGAASWRDPHNYNNIGPIYNGEIGAFESVRFIETPRSPLDLTGGSADTVDLYSTIIMGRQSLAKAHSITDGNGAYPKVVRGPVVDSLMRFNPIGWYWLGGYGIFRQAAIRVVNSSSSLGGS